MSNVDERTRLISDSRPRYVFETNSIRERKRRVRTFQCCLCTIFLAILIAGIVITIAFNLDYSGTSEDSDNTTTALPVDNLVVLLSRSFPLDDNNEPSGSLDDAAWSKAMKVGLEGLKSREELERNVTVLPLNSPSYKHQKVVATSAKARNLSRQGVQEEIASRFYFQNSQNTPLNISRVCNYVLCQNVTVQCDPNAKYRTYNGSCNNLQRPNEFGVAYRPFRRALRPDYGDGLNKPRMGKEGGLLPSARTVSLEVHRPYYKNDFKFSVMLAVWGQFLDHDITATALSQTGSAEPISCCGLQEQNGSGVVLHPECFPVALDSFDPLVRYNVTCMEFVRSAPYPNCCLGPREQMTQVSAFIDGSVIYGTDDDVIGRVRSMQGGKLEMLTTEDNRTLLPLSKDLADGCNRIERYKMGQYCFFTGDARANENLHLTSMHLLWARNHNHLAEALSQLNPHWDDERVFQEARKITGAQMQHITYNEFLGILLGDQLMERFELNPRKVGTFGKYDAAVDATIANNFATAAFRFAHSIIPGLMKVLAHDTTSPEFVQMHKMLFDPFKLYGVGELDRSLRGAMETAIEANDPYFTEELKNHLFEEPSQNGTKSCGLDLVSLNIQRGRDHGLPPYNAWREHCGLERARTFHDLRGDIDGNVLRNIESVYRSVDDIDLYSGALSEKPLSGSILGPTLTCLILDQFVRIKYGDRFWYENPQIFTSDQLQEIRKTTLAKVICENADDVREVQPRVMEKMRQGNEMESCILLAGVSLEPWKEGKLARVGVPSENIAVRAFSNKG